MLPPAFTALYAETRVSEACFAEDRGYGNYSLSYASSEIRGDHTGDVIVSVEDYLDFRSVAAHFALYVDGVKVEEYWVGVFDGTIEAKSWYVGYAFSSVGGLAEGWYWVRDSWALAEAELAWYCPV